MGLRQISVFKSFSTPLCLCVFISLEIFWAICWNFCSKPTSTVRCVFPFSLLPYPPKVCSIACRTISQVPSRKWDLVRICNGIEAEERRPSKSPYIGRLFRTLSDIHHPTPDSRISARGLWLESATCIDFPFGRRAKPSSLFTLHSSFFTFTLQSYYNFLWKSQSNIFFYVSFQEIAFCACNLLIHSEKFSEDNSR